MLSFYDAIYLSPHLDDAILSCGGQIHLRVDAGQSVLIATVTAGNPPRAGLSTFAQGLHRRWQTLADVVSVRRLEDKEACGYVGADMLHWPLLDCIYRQDPQTGKSLYPSEESLFGPILPGDELTISRVSQLLNKLPDWGQIVVPLAVGNHVDHQICRQAAEDVFGAATITYYEEYPYAQAANVSDFPQPSKLAWKSTVIQLTEEAQATKLEAIACYRSQLSTFFSNRDDMNEQVQAYHRRVGGERLWRLT
jgi:LmbE family N-acetylglucosaminyl deacetylase